MAVAGTFTPAQNERHKLALAQDRPYDFAVEEIRRSLEQGVRAGDLKRRTYTGVGGGKRNGYRYMVANGTFSVSLWHGKPIVWHMGMHRLIIDANYERLGCPRQPSLWEQQEATA